MRHTTRYAIILLGAALVVGFAIAGSVNPLATPPKARPFTPSPVIFPDQEIPLRFFHDKHLAEDMDCTDCHDAAETSVRSSDILVPVGLEGEETCANCHDMEEGADADPPSACSTCHTDAYKPTFPDGVARHETDKALNKPASMVFPAPRLKMNHKIHVDNKIACSTCHGDLKDVQVATRDNALPLMGKCLECHDGSTAPSECRTCHVSRADGRLVSTYGTELLKPAGHYRMDAHDDNYLKTHAQTARGDEAYCSQCHEENYCLKCHNGVSRPLKIHPNNWILIHPVSARRNNPTCTSCHRLQSFCVDCHQRSNVAHTETYGTQGNGNGYSKLKYGGFHPAGWVDDIVKKGSVRGPRHHSFQAKRNIRACASCHVEKTCARCHSMTAQSGNFGFYKGQGISPHGVGFSGSRKCKALIRTNKRMCVKCHSSSDPLLNNCR
jgi:c(7)-type cytochrome triheme protein